MPHAEFLVCEAANRWLVAVRWAQGTPRAVGDLDACSARLREAPASFLALELTASNVPSLVDHLQDLRHRFPLARAVVVCDRSLAPCQWLLREAGAVDVAVSIREAATVVELAQRHLSLVEPPPVGFRQAVWERLPWQEK